MINKIYILISWASLVLILIIYLTAPLHPIHILILLIIYNSILCINITTWKATSIFAILFFLIIVRGLLIIFLYFSSLISNEKARININKSKIVYLNLSIWIIFILVTFFVPLTPAPSPPSSSFDLIYIPIPLYTYNEHFSTTLLFESPLLFLTLLNITFLFLSIFLIRKICSPKSKSIRKIK